MDIPRVFFNHLLLSIVPWVVGGLIGGGLGYLLARVIRPLGAQPGLCRALKLLPWRAMAFVLATIAVYHAYPVITLSPVFRSVLPVKGFFVHVTVSISIAVIALALPFTTSIFISYWFPPSLWEKLVAGARTLGVISVVLALNAEKWGIKVAGAVMRMNPFDSDYSEVWFGYGILFSIALIVDLGMGAIQMAIARPAEAEIEV